MEHKSLKLSKKCENAWCHGLGAKLSDNVVQYFIFNVMK